MGTCHGASRAPTHLQPDPAGAFCVIKVLQGLVAPALLAEAGAHAVAHDAVDLEVVLADLVPLCVLGMCFGWGSGSRRSECVSYGA